MQPEKHGTNPLQELSFGGVLSVVQTVASTQAIALFRQHGRIMRMADVACSGISRNTLFAMRDAGEVLQLALGLYRLAEMSLLGSKS